MTRFRWRLAAGQAVSDLFVQAVLPPAPAVGTDSAS